MGAETGLRIKKIREFRNLTQEHMADKLDISQNVYSRIERGLAKISTDRLEEIAKVLDVPVDSLLNSEKQIFNFDNANCYVENGQIDINPLEKIVELYERLLESERKKNELLEEQLRNVRKAK